MQTFDPAGRYCATWRNNINTSVHRGTPNSYLPIYTLNHSCVRRAGRCMGFQSIFFLITEITQMHILCSPQQSYLYNCKKKYRILLSNKMTIKDNDQVSNIAVQYVPMCDFWCFSCRLPLWWSFSLTVMKVVRCALQWCLLVQSILKQICSGLCVSACCLGSIHPLTCASPLLTSPSQEMTGESNHPQSLFCSLNPPPPVTRHVQMWLPPACQPKSCCI